MNSHWIGVLVVSALLAGLAETLEMVTYYPAPAAAGGDHLLAA